MGTSTATPEDRTLTDGEFGKLCQFHLDLRILGRRAAALITRDSVHIALELARILDDAGESDVAAHIRQSADDILP